MSEVAQSRFALSLARRYSVSVRIAGIFRYGSLVFACVFALSGCPKRQVPTQNTTLKVPTSGDGQARSRFELSRNRFEQDAKIDTSEDFEAIVRDYPNDPIVPHALLYGAMADLRNEDPQSAMQKLDKIGSLPDVDPAMLSHVKLVQGFALLEVGQTAQALAHLEAGEGAIQRSNSDELHRWHAGVAAAAAASGQNAKAVVHYDEVWTMGSDSEKAYAQDRIETLVAQLPVSSLRQVFIGLTSKSGPAAAIVGSRLAPLLLNSEDPNAQELLTAISSAMRSMGLGSSLPGNSGPGDASTIGALLPMTGRLNRVGELSMRALILASGQSPRSGETPSFEVHSRDTNSDAALVSEGMTSLVKSEALAIVGPFDGRALKAALPLASRLGVPLISLAPRGGIGSGVYNIRHSAESRARILARYAYGVGVRDFAILTPKSSYGKVVGAAFRQEVEKLGGVVVVSADYPKGTTSFKKYIGKLRKPWSAIFVPDVAKSLALIAPALAVGNLHAMPVGKKSKRGRSVLLLSTAEGVDSGFLRSAGRYALGAVLAPGFYPDRTDNRIAEFVLKYEAEFGTLPGVHEAYAFDAATVIRHAVDAGAFTRDLLRRELYRQEVPGLTGTIRFDSQGRRSDLGLLYEVKEPVSGQFELGALR